MKVEAIFGVKIVSEIDFSEMPLSRAELLKRYGNKIVAFQWDIDREILFKDLLGFVTVKMFNTKLELATELSKAYRRYMYEKSCET